MPDRILTAMDYLGLRREVGDVVDDIPATSRPWLLAQGHIKEVIQSVPAEEPQSPAPEATASETPITPVIDAPIAPPEPSLSDTPIDPQSQTTEDPTDSPEPPQAPEGAPQMEGGN